VPRRRRVGVRAGTVHHVLNRGNQRALIFAKGHDYNGFVDLLREAGQRFPVDLLAFCLMPNHWHLVLRPESDDALPAYMQWICTTHVRRYQEHAGTAGTGHVYQGRYKNFIVQTDRHLLSVLRYVEANALRAGLVSRAEDWPWSSFGLWVSGAADGLLRDWPVPRPADWIAFVNGVPTDVEIRGLRLCAARGRPYGGDDWSARTAVTHGLEVTLKPRGRPRKRDHPRQTYVK